MWSKIPVVFLAENNQLATPGWVIDRLHAYSDYFQKVTFFGSIIRQVGIFLVMLLYSIDSLFAKMIFSVLGMSLAADASKTGADFNPSLLGLLGNAAFLKIVQVGMGLGIMTLGGVGLWLYLKLLIGKNVQFGEVFSNLFSTAIIAFATPVLLVVSLRGGAYFFTSLAMRNFTTDPATNQVSIAKTTASLSEDFVWSFVKTDIVATGDAVTGQYQINGDKRVKNTDWDINKVQADPTSAADYNAVIKNNFPIDPNEPRKENIGSQATSQQLDNFSTALAGQKELITPTVTSWFSELDRAIPLPSDYGKKSDNWFEAFKAKVSDLFGDDDATSTWGIMAMSTYDTDTYNTQMPGSDQAEGSGSKLIPISKTDMIPFSKGRYFYYSINWSIIITLIAIGLLLLDIFYKLTIALLDILATLFIGWSGMVATAESGRGNAVFIESMMNYGKVSLVSGASLGLYIITINYVKGMFTALKASGTLNGVEALIASPILIVVLTFAFLNGSGAFIKFVGVDAGFGIAGGLFGAMMGKKGLGKAAGRVSEAGGALMNKGINALSGNKSEQSTEKAAQRDVKRNYNKAASIINTADREMEAFGNHHDLASKEGQLGMAQIKQQRDEKLEALASTKSGSPLAKNLLGVQPSAQRLAQQRLGMLTQKAERGLATEAELRELDMMNRSRTGYAKANLLQRATGTTARDLTANAANQVDKAGRRKGAINLSQLNANQQRAQWHNELKVPRQPIHSDIPKETFDFEGEGTTTDSNASTTRATTGSGSRQVYQAFKDKDTVIQPIVEAGRTTTAPVDDQRTPIQATPPDLASPKIKTSEGISGTQHIKNTIKGPDIKIEQKVEQGKVERGNLSAPPRHSEDYFKNMPTPPLTDRMDDADYGDWS